MFFVVVGAIFAAPSVLGIANRVVNEILIPRKEMKNLRKRRQAQAEAGVPEEKREVFHHLPLHMLDIELTEEEFLRFKELGVLDVLLKAGRPRVHTKKMDDQQKVS